ncbi:MAG: hypothetical protein WC528_05485 [Patescibacteria group bacterium]
MISVVLSSIAIIGHVIAFVIYNKQMLKGESRPNAATWSIWVLGVGLNCATYIVMSGDIIKALILLAGSLGCTWTFFFSLFKGKLTRLNPWDIVAMIIGFFASFVWWHYRNATMANMILQIPIVISFLPTYRGIIRNPRNEKALPWFLWSGAYLLTIFTVILRWQDKPLDLVNPINYLFLHAGIGLFAQRKKLPS